MFGNNYNAVAIIAFMTFIIIDIINELMPISEVYILFLLACFDIFNFLLLAPIHFSASFDELFYLKA